MEPTKHKTIRALLVDDDEDDYLIVRTLLNKVREADFKLEWASSYTEGETIIAEQRHDLYLIDYRLGAETGIELLSHVEPLKRSEPFIILTGAGDERIEQQAMKLGAADYLV
ncbi:MAG TPA: response regulator, partial [Candidatus Saccharimonadales bacterium]|nr:response regulator [Candidatus Saccharimonadales bacterium]